MKQYLTISPCNLETRALCLGAWVIKIGLSIFESKEESQKFVQRLFETQDKNIMLEYSGRVHIPKFILSQIFNINDFIVGRILKVA